MCEDGVFIRVPIPTGRVDDDRLSPTEQAFVNALSGVSVVRLRAIVDELLSREAFRLQLEELLNDLPEA